MNKGAVILCGGKSSRMGSDKAMLPFGPERMLQRVVRLLSQVVEPHRIVVVAAPNQRLPDLPAAVALAYDGRQDRGPLEGLAAGLRAMDPETSAVYVTSCDVPLLVPCFVERMFERLESHAIAVPRDGAHYHPLSAVYRLSVLPHVQRLLDADCLRVQSLFPEVDTLAVPVDELRRVDAQLSTLENVNHPQDYLAALAAAGLMAAGAKIPESSDRPFIADR
jgi:molybdopterin-guanine dinucleotide biosynthesis protein A